MTTACSPIVQLSPTATPSWRRACGLRSQDFPTIAPSTRALRPMYVDESTTDLVVGVEVRLPELVEIADVLPVAVGDEPVERLAHLEEQREELLREVERLA